MCIVELNIYVLEYTLDIYTKFRFVLQIREYQSNEEINFYFAYSRYSKEY